MITVLTGSLIGGGAEKNCVLLCNELSKRGYEVNVWVLQKINLKSISLSKKIAVTSLNLKYSRSSFFKILTLLKKKNPPIIFSYNPQLSVILVMIRIIYKKKFKIISRSINTLSHEYSNKNSLWTKIIVKSFVKFFYKKSDLIIAQSLGMKNDLKSFFGIDENKISTIYNPAFLQNNQSNAIKSGKIKLHEILYIGRFEKQKNLFTLLELFSQMAKIDDKLNMRMVGEGSLKNKIIKHINNNGLDKKIIIQNYDNNPYDLYKKAKITVLVSNYEGMPNVLLESISLGTPVVSFDIDHGPREIIKNGVNGFLVPNGDRKLFIKRVFEIINGDKVFNINNLKKSINKFSLENVIDEYEKEIKRIADS